LGLIPNLAAGYAALKRHGYCATIATSNTLRNVWAGWSDWFSGRFTNLLVEGRAWLLKARATGVVVSLNGRTWTSQDTSQAMIAAASPACPCR
jgi:hypothetical protein